jgi:hypothetical protein
MFCCSIFNETGTYEGGHLTVINLIDEEPMPLKWFLCSKYFQDGGWELVKGELVAMSPAKALHEAVVQRIGYLFQSVIGEGNCTVYGSNIGICMS